MAYYFHCGWSLLDQPLSRLCVGRLNMISKTKVKSLRRSPPGPHCQFVRHQKHGKSAHAACEAWAPRSPPRDFSGPLAFISRLRHNGCPFGDGGQECPQCFERLEWQDCLHALAFQHVLLHKRDFYSQLVQLNADV